MDIEFDIKVDFFEENQKSVEKVLYADPVLSKTLEDIIAFMSYMGIEKVTLSGKTKDDDRNYRENLKTRKVEI